MPYTWGTVGIIYNEPMIEELTGKPADEVVTGWDAFWNEDLKDNMFMFINSRDSFGIGELYLGKSLNETDPTVLEQVADALKQQDVYKRQIPTIRSSRVASALSISFQMVLLCSMLTSTMAERPITTS